VKAVILAGGRGRRMLPYTSILPKPLMPIGDHSVLEIVLQQLRASGFDDVVLSVGHLSHLIRAVLENGARPEGMSISYVQENEPLGTAGPLRLIDDLSDTFLAMNGDVLTTLDLRRLVDAHRRSGNLITIATHERIETIDFGVLRVQEAENGTEIRRVATYDEKPELTLNVSMGIYVIERAALEYIPEGYFDFPDLVLALLGAGATVGAYMYDGYWLDIGRHDDYERAVAEWARVATSEPGHEELVVDLDAAVRATHGSGAWDETKPS
jgi:NDP-sugar pyrophosphorylase family protein